MRKSTFRKSLLLSIFTSIFFFGTSVYAELEEACEVFYHGDANHLKDSTVEVPEQSVALSSKVVVVPPDDEVIKIGSAPSIFFVIDHSGSMTNNPGNDRMGQRFSVTNAIIDTLFSLFDSAEVGVCVFRQHMYFDPADDPRFAQAPGYDTGAYIPLLKLDSSYAPSGEWGYQILHNYLETDTVGTGSGAYVDLKYTPSNLSMTGHTNINAGFAAAKHAMKSAKYTKNRQFVIFLSDGEATYPDDETKFLKDVEEDIPTTFTIYFTDDNQVPWQIDSLTKVIKGNGYSVMNDSTKYFTIDLVQQDLMQFFEDNILDVIIGQVLSTPLDITVNGSSVSNFTNNSFTFDDLFPLTGAKTTFDYNINYTIAKDSIIFDDNQNPVDTIQIQKDSTSKGKFYINVVDGASLPTHYPKPFSLYCWQRGLEFYNGSTKLNYADETMNDLKVRFDFEEGDSTDYSYSTIEVDLTTTEGNKQDKETVTLSKSNDYWIKDFIQEIIEDSKDPKPDDGKLQHYAFDSLVATFRNKESPKLPLDTVRHAIPFRLKGFIQSEAAYYYDRNADGYVDSIVVNIQTDLDDGLTKEHLDEIMEEELLTLPSFRGFSINSYRVLSDESFALRVTEDNSHDPVTYIRSDDSIKVDQKILSIGGWVEAATIPIYDKVAPILMKGSKTFDGNGYPTPLLVDFQDTIADTLFVDFSEPVKDISHDVPFYFLAIDGNVEYTADLVQQDLNSTRAKFTVTDINGNTVTNFHTGDSVWIHEKDRVFDICKDENGATANNPQNNKDNKKRMLTVTFVAIDLKLDPISITPLNLSDINNESVEIPDTLINLFIQQNMLEDMNLQLNDNGNFIGMVIQINPDFGDNDIESFEKLLLEGEISIFDAVGNTILDKSDMLFFDAKKQLIFLWNGRNTQNRPVGAGSYLAVIDIKKYPMGKEGSYQRLSKRRMLGVLE